MEAHRLSNGTMNDPSERNSQPAVPRRTSARLRLPTVHEALPYSPFTSIVPFNAGVITPPVTIQNLSPNTFSNSEEYKASRKVLDQLNASANGAEVASRRCKQTLQDVQKLLNPDGLMNFIFKQRKPILERRAKSQSAAKPTSKLSPFAKMVLEGTNVSYRYPTPESPRSAGNRLRKEQATMSDTIVVQPQPRQNGEVPLSKLQEVQVVIPASITPMQRAEYTMYTEPDPIRGAYDLSPSKQRQSNNRDASRHVSTDQKHRSDLAVQNLQSLLASIFDAEDHLQSDTFDVATVDPSKMLAVRETDEGTVLTLLFDVQNKVESHIQKVAAANRLDDFDFDSLIRLQKLGEGAVAPVPSLSLSIGEDWVESDVEEWLNKLSTAETGLAAARTTMRIMAGMPLAKELQAEALLHQILEALKNVIEYCIVPLIEMPAFTGEKIRGQKEGPPADPRFTIAASHRQALQSLLNSATKSLRMVGELLVKTDFDQVNITTVEFLCKTLVFAENATSERESALGVQTFETMRRCAMDVFAKVFTKYADQRQYIFDEILFSLEKLPATKQSARQYRLADSKPIQLVSALLMRLIQTSATPSNEAVKISSESQDSEGENKLDDDEGDSEDAEGSSYDDDEPLNLPSRKPRNGTGVLGAIVKPLSESAQKHASYIVRYLINRASSSTKTGDEPYRKLLDIFTEDFINVLGSPDWPAAELLLFTLARNMVGIAENAKNAAPARTMALEFLGIMGSGILELHIATRYAARAIDAESDIGYHLSQMVDQADSGQLDNQAVIALDGPYRMVLEYLGTLDDNDSQIQTARGYHLTEWASVVSGVRAVSVDSNEDGVHGKVDLQSTLKSMIQDPQWLGEHSQIAPVSAQEARLATRILTLNSKFCRAFNRIFSTLLASMSSEQPTLRSRSLKSVDALLEKDPAVLDRNANVLQHIFHRSNDASPLVRDSALGLIAKCISLRPDLDSSVYQQVILRTKDSASGVKRRAVKLLKDIYLRNEALEIRSAIASALIAKAKDVEASVAEMARTTIEDVFFQQFYGLQLEGDGHVKAKLAYSAHAALLIHTLEENEEVIQVFESLLKRLLYRSKAASSNLAVCKTLIAALFDGIIDSSDIPGSPSQDMILRTLTVFSKASPKLFTAAQLERLEPYLSNLSTSEDLEIYRSAITILRHAIPYQTLLKPEALGQLQTNLLKTVSKIPKADMRSIAKEVAPCVWTISNMIGGSAMLSNFVKSAISQIAKLRKEDFNANPQSIAKVVRLICIVGEFGKACDFNTLLDEWRSTAFLWFGGNSVPGLMVEPLCEYTSPSRPLDVRIAALSAICSISQAWPMQFLRSDVTNAFEMVFEDNTPDLVEALLSGLETFFCSQEISTDDDDNDASDLGGGIASGKERLGRTYVASDEDSALTSMAQRFLPQIRRLALEACNEPAYIAARLIITINSQGLGHPKESAPALVALETCPNAVIAKRAFDAHKDQGLSRESVFEKEYMRGVHLAFEYQQRVLGESVGFHAQPPVSKLHFLWDVLKAGKAGVRNKFLNNLARKVEFDLSNGVSVEHMLFSHFVLGNIAFFDYEKVDELLALVATLEKIFSATGAIVAQAIESEVLPQSNGFEESTFDDAIQVALPAVRDAHPIDMNSRSRQLATASQILCAIWETRSFIRRLWNLQKFAGKLKKAAKEGNRTAYRATTAPSLTEAYQRKIQELAIRPDSMDKVRGVCSSFIELFSVDSEVKVASEDEMDADGDDGYNTPSEAGSGKSGSQPPGSGAGRSKKRKASLSNGTPRKKSRPSFGKKKSSSFTGRGKDFDDDSPDEDGDDSGGWD